MKVAVVGAGWAGLACAIEATRAGHRVTLFEAARMAGGRARHLDERHGGVRLDNGQHILIGAYRDTLALMRTVGMDPELALHRMPLSLRFADGRGLALPRLPPPLDLLAGIASAPGWTWRDKAALLRSALRWRMAGFRCADDATVAALCDGITPRVMAELIEPLCVSALNTPVEESSGQVFLRVLDDALFSGRGGADLLLPRVDLGALFPDAALRWLARHGATLRIGTRVQNVTGVGDIEVGDVADAWQVDGETFDAVILACAPWDAARLVRAAAIAGPVAADWLRHAEALRFEAIATVYFDGATPLGAPMLALRPSPQAPAQFAFDRGQLGGPSGMLALVVSASEQPREILQAQVHAQAEDQLRQHGLRVVQTVVEKRATFACTPSLRRPSLPIARGLAACGDYIAGPYPATLEGAIRSGVAAAKWLADPTA